MRRIQWSGITGISCLGLLGGRRRRIAVAGAGLQFPAAQVLAQGFGLAGAASLGFGFGAGGGVGTIHVRASKQQLRQEARKAFFFEKKAAPALREAKNFYSFAWAVGKGTTP
jgi:hypothetical protein